MVTPRRCSKRWLDADCPDGVLCIFDHPKFADRYTVIYREVHTVEGYPPFVMGRGMSENPFHPQGVGLIFEMKLHQLANYRYANKRRYAKWSSLPEKVKECVLQDLELSLHFSQLEESNVL